MALAGIGLSLVQLRKVQFDNGIGRGHTLPLLRFARRLLRGRSLCDLDLALGTA
jgi:hypothetical protein